MSENSHPSTKSEQVHFQQLFHLGHPIFDETVKRPPYPDPFTPRREEP
jgi:hypothetical protein